MRRNGWVWFVIWLWAADGRSGRNISKMTNGGRLWWLLWSVLRAQLGWSTLLSNFSRRPIRRWTIPIPEEPWRWYHYNWYPIHWMISSGLSICRIRKRMTGLLLRSPKVDMLCMLWLKSTVLCRWLTVFRVQMARRLTISMQQLYVSIWPECRMRLNSGSGRCGNIYGHYLWMVSNWRVPTGVTICAKSLFVGGVMIRSLCCRWLCSRPVAWVT